MPPQLRCRDLRAGDVLLQLSSGSIAGKAIQWGQKVIVGANWEYVHAGIMFDSTYFIEALWQGIDANDLRIKNKEYGYHVFRCRNLAVASGAGTCAKMMFDIQKQGHTVPYSTSKAIASIFGKPGSPSTPSQMDDLLDAILHGRHHSFFCSQLVVYVYQFVATQCGLAASSLFSVSDAKASPSVLATKMKTSALFSEAGYLKGNER